MNMNELLPMYPDSVMTLARPFPVILLITDTETY